MRLIVPIHGLPILPNATLGHECLFLLGSLLSLDYGLILYEHGREIFCGTTDPA